MAPPTFEYFFDLPPELRELILSYICLVPSGILVGCGFDGRSIPRSFAAKSAVYSSAVTHDDQEDDIDEDDYADPLVNLFLASPLLYREAGDLYYGRNVFYLDFTPVVWGRRQQEMFQQQGLDESGLGFNLRDGHETRSRGATAGGRRNGTWGTAGNNDRAATVMRLISHPKTAGARWRIRHAVVSIRRFGGLVTDVLIPRLGDMVLNGALRRLRVDLTDGFPFVARENEERDSRDTLSAVYLENPALRALLVLLADPDLESAELRVPRRFWAKFHQRTRRALPRSLGQGHAEEFVEVDLPWLMKACAGDAAEFRIKKVS